MQKILKILRSGKPLVLMLVPLTISLAQAQDYDALRRSLSDPDRDLTDYARDAARKPVAVLEFLSIAPGMTVLDVYAAGGYYTYILSKAVGPEGIVYAQNTRRGLQFIEDRQDITQGEALANKIRAGKLDNVTQLIGALDEIDIASNSLDAVMLAQTLHDFYNGNPDRALTLLRRLYDWLKPGGVIAVTDHVGLPGRDNRQMHRMEIGQAIAVAEAAGFTAVSSDLLRNPDDDKTRSIFDPRLNRNTDRFLLKLTKPR